MHLLLLLLIFLNAVSIRAWLKEKVVLKSLIGWGLLHNHFSTSLFNSQIRWHSLKILILLISDEIRHASVAALSFGPLRNQSRTRISSCC